MNFIRYKQDIFVVVVFLTFLSNFYQHYFSFLLVSFSTDYIVAQWVTLFEVFQASSNLAVVVCHSFSSK